MRSAGDPRVAELKKKYADVFSPELGCLKNVEVKFDLDQSVSPRFCRPRNIPYAYRKQVEEQLETEVEAGILEPVRTSEWACQIVPIVKQDGKSIRICGNFKQAANRAIKVDKHPVPKGKDMFAKLSGEKVFAKLDLSRAYQQLKVAEQHRPLLTINTHRGLSATVVWRLESHHLLEYFSLRWRDCWPEFPESSSTLMTSCSAEVPMTSSWCVWNASAGIRSQDPSIINKAIFPCPVRVEQCLSCPNRTSRSCE